MSKIRKHLKNLAGRMPEPIGRLAAIVPFSWRFGSAYTASRKGIDQFYDLERSQQRQYVFKRMRGIVEHAYRNVPFYQAHYADHGFNPSDLQDFDDIGRVPVVTKRDLRAWPVEERSVPEIDRMEMNTGGTSGSPLHFYLDTNAFAREWAHMHEIWAAVDYKPTDLKLTFRGRDIGSASYTYDAAYNEYVINSYMPLEALQDDLLELIRNKNIHYIHGYPSAIYEFARHCDSAAPALTRHLRSALRGILLGSEYPAPIYRDTIEEVFDVPTVSWYGHSEMAILAYEPRKPFKYVPMHTYGYCEALPDGNGEYRLVGTSYQNTASPFIRYDTGDRVKNVDENRGLLQAFEIASGRVGDFVVDRAGHRVSLTALIFGRHHEIFRYAEFIQVRQEQAGRATIFVTPADSATVSKAYTWSDFFNDENVDMHLRFEEVEEPIRSQQGKVKLLV